MGDGRPARRGGSPAAGAQFPVPPGPATLPGWYPALLASVSTRVSDGQQRAVTAANRELLATYWAIGADILARQHEQGWGSRIIDTLSADLRERFPDARGLLPAEPEIHAGFAAAWPDPAMVQDRLAQLPWYHQVALLEKLSPADLRLWYAGQAAQYGWSRDVLARHIANRFHQRAGNAVTNFADTLPPGDSDLAQQVTRDPYLFDFIGRADVRRETGP